MGRWFKFPVEILQVTWQLAPAVLFPDDLIDPSLIQPREKTPSGDITSAVPDRQTLVGSYQLIPAGECPLSRFHRC